MFYAPKSEIGEPVQLTWHPMPQTLSPTSMSKSDEAPKPIDLPMASIPDTEDHQEEHWKR